MIRTQIMLPAKLKKTLKQKADKKDLSMGELIRRYLTEKITSDDNQSNKNTLLELAEEAEEGIKDINSENFRQNYDKLSK